MLVVITTDAVVPAARPRRRAARRDPCELRPARLRRLHVHQRHRHGPGQRGQRHHARAAGLHRRADPALHRPGHAAARATPRAPTTTSPSPRSTPPASPTRWRSDERGPEQPVQGRGVRPGPQLGPGARLHRHHAGGVRPGRPRRGHERRLGLQGVRAAEDPATVDLSGREVTVTIDLKAGSERATVWTNDLTHAYVHENSAYSS